MRIPSTHRVSIGFLLALTVVSGCRERPRADQMHSASGRPSVLFVTFCTMRTDRIGAYGEKADDGPSLTPTLDRLAADGWLFRAHYTQATYSGGSFASMLTGRYPFHHGIYDHPRQLADSETTIGEVFRDAGYATGAFLTHRYLGAKWNYVQGFEVVNRFGASEESEREASEGSRGRPEPRVEAALDWVASLGDRPYLLWYQSQLTHYFPRVEPPAVSEETYRKAMGFRKRTEGVPAGRLMFEFESLDPSTEELQALLAMYDAAVRETDRLVARLIAGLEHLGKLDNTIIVIAADHGEALGEGGIYFNHDANLREPTVRVPFILRDPKHGSGVIDQVTRNIDLLPTLATLAGLEVPDQIDGVSLLPLIEGGAVDLEAFAETRPLVKSRQAFEGYPLEIAGFEGKLRMIRQGADKLVVYPRVEGYRMEMFDLAADPDEVTNLAPDQPELARSLATELEHWFAGYRNAESSPLELDDEDLESLRSLGYID